jgi:hypothetical protein
MNNQNPGNGDNQSLTLYTTSGQAMYSPDQYLENLRKIEMAQRALQEVVQKNEVGLRNYVEDQKRKIAEGQAALCVFCQ